MADHIIIDANRQPAQIRCLHCGFAQDLQLPMAIRELVALEKRISAEHRRCKLRRGSNPPPPGFKPSPPPGPPAVRFTEGPTNRNNAGPGPTTPKPAIVPRPQPRRGRFQPQ